jgi:nucleotide-binding universal stress UspA family protein
VVAPVPPHVTHFIDRKVLDDYYEEEAQKVLEPVQAFAKRHKWNVTALHRVGHAADVIAKMATTGKFDLLVMGSHGHSNLKSLLLGSVTTRVMALRKTPLLIIR